jgi:hypothetical protein
MTAMAGSGERKHPPAKPAALAGQEGGGWLVAASVNTRRPSRRRWRGKRRRWPVAASVSIRRPSRRHWLGKKAALADSGERKHPPAKPAAFCGSRKGTGGRARLLEGQKGIQKDSPVLHSPLPFSQI